MTNPADTQPKSPTGLSEAIQERSLEDTGQHQPVLPPPMKIDNEPACLRTLLILAVIGISSCMCLAIVSLAGFAGIRDEVEVIGTQAVEIQQTDVADQYQRGVTDMQAGNYELAEPRFEYVLTEIPNYADAENLLAQVQTILNITPTSSSTPTVSATETPQPTSTSVPEATLEVTEEIPAATATRSGPNPEGLYTNAETAMFMGNYEEAISWLEALIQLDPSYRRTEARNMLIEALSTQGLAYLRGMNQDGEDQLARGVQLIDRAGEFGYSDQEVIYEADFVRRYLSARSYVEGGALGQALDVLYQLCLENCDWAYHGVSVEDLLNRAGGVRQN